MSNNNYEKFDYTKFDRINLIKIINLYEDINEKDLLIEIKNKINNQTNDFKKKILFIKLESIITEYSKKKYIDKIKYKEFVLYYYANNTIKVYINDINNIKALFDILNTNSIFEGWINSKKKKKKIVFDSNNIKSISDVNDFLIIHDISIEHYQNLWNNIENIEHI